VTELRARLKIGEGSVETLADIIRSKEIADRAKHREALEELRSLRDVGSPS